MNQHLLALIPSSPARPWRLCRLSAPLYDHRSVVPAAAVERRKRGLRLSDSARLRLPIRENRPLASSAPHPQLRKVYQRRNELFYGDLYELFEGAFPGEFGGGPGDHQLVEEEDKTGQTRLTLVVHPEVKAVDEKRILARLKAELSKRSRGDRFMTDLWANAGRFKLKRAVPHASPRGKILPLHIVRGGDR